MPAQNFFEFGYFAKTHGHQGALRAKYTGDFPDNYKNLESVFIEENEQPVPFFIQTLSWKGDHILINLQGIESKEAAERFIGKKILLPEDLLPELEEGDYFLHELIGLIVIDKDYGELGRVTAYFDQTPQTMIQIDYKGKDLLIPMVDEFILELDIEEGLIQTKLPGGYLDSFISE